MTIQPLAPVPSSAWSRAAGRFPFAFGGRFFLLLLAGLPLLLPAWVDPRAVWLMLAWDALVVTAWCADVRRLPDARQLRFTRIWQKPLCIGVDDRVDLEVENHGGVEIHASVTDYTAASLRLEPARAAVTAPAGGLGVTSYAVEPRARGDAAMGVAAVRYRSAWGIGERRAVAPIEQVVRVYPDLPEARRQAMYLVRSRQVALEKRRARITGLGRDFESLRDYRDGDEPRDISWTASARRARLVTRVYRPERSQAVWILVDAGRLLRARLGREVKLDRLVNGALALTQVALAAGDRVGVLVYGRDVRQRLAPGRGPQHLRAIVEALAGARAEPAEADHASAAACVMASQKPRALIVWLTELAETAGVPEVIESAVRLTRRHVVLFTVLQQAEMNALAAAAPASQEEMYRILAAQEILERREVLLGNLRQRGALVIEVPAPDLTSALVTEYLGVKDRNLI